MKLWIEGVTKRLTEISTNHSEMRNISNVILKEDKIVLHLSAWSFAPISVFVITS